MEPSILKKLNSALLKNCTPPDQKYQLRLPAGMKESAKIALNEIFAENNENNYPTRHIVKKGESEGEILIETDTGLSINRKKRTQSSDYKSIKQNEKEINSPESFLKEIFTPMQLNPVEFNILSK